MGEPTSRYYAERQGGIIYILQNLVAAAYHRYCITTDTLFPDDPDELQLVSSVTEVARADNESLAKSARLIVAALLDMAAQGWIDDETAASLAFKFAGEPLGPDDIAEILAKSTKAPEED